ncbi:UMF4 family major facilitator superfamily permease [Candidatus Mancarchaeum acidiphilum]|uniref:UMF4 family major facilitator superfamily permease n=1 Tax=Candidatus Mancarchaeum acidiphilum TaxID=1920749 RepID=A0A218NNI9_9ARCH|nr:MFS transporter [Candidatus Mancarchaeum acidiphilum]ASI14019.1 UMF4 family major facilitator superfamily permease [Candidatus Mancarchaeum acidiphilum]
MDKNKFYLLYSMLILIAFTFAVRSSNNAFMTTIPLFVKQYFNFTETDVGILAGFSSLVTFISTAFVNSRLCSRTRRYLFIVANALITISFVLIFFSNYLSIWVYILILSFSAGIIMPNIITSAGVSEDRKIRERMMGIYTLALSASLIAGPFIESIVLDYFPLKYAFLLFAPISLVALILSPFMKFPIAKSEDSGKGVKVWKNHGFKLAIYSILMYNAPFAMIVFFSGIFAEQSLGLSSSAVMLMFSLLFTISFISRLALSYFVPSNLWRYIKLSMLLTAIGLLTVFLSKDLFLYAIGIIVLGVPHGLTYPLSISAIGRSFDMSSRNKANSYFFAVIMLINIVVPTIAGGLISAVGFRETMLLVVPIIIILFLLARPEAKVLKALKENKMQSKNET